MCYIQWNNFWPTKIFWLSFLLKNRKNFLAQGVLNQFFASLWLCCWLQTPLLAQFDMQYLLENSLAKMQTPLNALLSLSHPQEKWDCPSNLLEEKMGETSLMRIIFLQDSTWTIASFFSLLKRNGIYWDFVLKSHRKWSKCVTFCNSIFRNCRENNLVLSVVGEG